MKKHTLLFLIITYLFTACSDDNDDNDDNRDNHDNHDNHDKIAYIPSQITLSPENGYTRMLVSLIYYDHKLRFERWYDSTLEYDNFKYDEKGNLISINYDTPNPDIYEYSKNEIRITNYNTEEILTIDNDGRLIKRIKRNIRYDDKITRNMTISYNNKERSVTVINNLQNKKSIIKYDNKKGIYSDVNMPRWYMALLGYYYPKHNDIESITYNEDNKVTYRNLIKYTFNEQGYPSIYRSEDESYTDGDGEIKEIPQWKSIWFYSYEYDKMKRQNS